MLSYQLDTKDVLARLQRFYNQRPADVILALMFTPSQERVITDYQVTPSTSLDTHAGRPR